MPRYDVENFCNDLGAFLQANLSNKLTAISAEKDDGISLLAPAAYFFQTMNNQEAAYAVYLFYGIVDIRNSSVNGGAAKTYEIHVMIMAVDDGEDANIANRMLRYQRALEELMTESYASVGGGLKITISSKPPISLTDLNTSRTERVIGIAINVTMP